MNYPLKTKLAQTYPLSEVTHAIANHTLTIYSVANSYDLLDQIDPEEFQKDERMPYWAEVWPASVALAEFVLTTDSFKDAYCLELGTGVGVVSVAAGLAGAQILATDYFAEALEFVQLNASVNQATVKTQLLDWREITLEQQFDFIVAADVLYEERNHLPILQALQRLLAPHGKAYISDPQRTIAQKFLTLATQEQFALTTVTRYLDWGDQSLPIDIHSLAHFAC